MAGSMATSVTAYERQINHQLRAGNVPAAAAAAAACRAAVPDARAGWYFGSVAALLAGQSGEALSLADQWLRRHPRDAQGLLQSAECHLALGDRAAAVRAATAAIGAAGTPALWDALGQFLAHVAEYPLARNAYDKALAVQPDDARLRVRRAALHQALGDLEQARDDLRGALAQSPGDAEALKTLVELERQTPERNDVAAMEHALCNARANSKEAATLYFGLAKAYDDLGDRAASWGHLIEGNRIERAGTPYDPTTDRAVIERLIEAFPELERNAPDTTGAAPIFIVGLPRTGTTLVERIVGRHSMVHPAGELPALREAVGRAVQRTDGAGPRNWSDFATRSAQTNAANIARDYLATAQTLRGQWPRFTDKQPTNFFFCPLILRAFPQGHIVHVTRHPLATCYAIFKTQFNDGYPFANELGELGAFFLGYRRLMEHWQRILPDRILGVAYEDLVTALEPTVRALLAHLDLPFEAQCLDFHLDPQPTATGSAAQVRQPLYDDSLHHWRHYERELAPLAAQLRAAGITLDQPGLSGSA
ncbi:MAG: tetratricopeptide repeat-containing sulfotransferase family protein [Steroidobacteraceae bacterium]